jgi:hypothetical protein
MDVPGTKPRHDWCQHALHPTKPGASTLVPGHGCKIYAQRPELCREFHCQWLIDSRYPDYWYPKTSKIIINAMVEHGKKFVAFVVDPVCPTRWREEPWFSDIKATAKAGIEGRLGEKWTTLVLIKDQRIPIIGSERMLRAAG